MARAAALYDASLGGLSPSARLGIHPEGQKQVLEALDGIIADCYQLLLLTQGCHWNVRGLHFEVLHELFGAYYKDLVDGIDNIAERMRQLDGQAPYTPSELFEVTRVHVRSGLKNQRDMIESLLTANEVVVRALRDAVSTSKKYDDDVTADLLTKRMGTHEEVCWYLRSQLQN